MISQAIPPTAIFTSGKNSLLKSRTLVLPFKSSVNQDKTQSPTNNTEPDYLKGNSSTKMVKQKIAMRVSMESAKDRAKALKTVAGLPGVISAAVEGDTIVVVGEEMDSITLTKTLRKKMRFAELVSVAPVPVQEKKKEEKAAAAGGSSELAKSVHPVPLPVPDGGHGAEPIQVHDNT